MGVNRVKIMDGDCWETLKSKTTTTTASTFANYADHIRLRSSDAASLRGKDVSTMCGRKLDKASSRTTLEEEDNDAIVAK